MNAFAADNAITASGPGWRVQLSESVAAAADARLPLAFEPLLALPPAHWAPADEAAGPACCFHLEDQAAGLTVAQLFVELSAELSAGDLIQPPQPAFGRLQTAAGLPAAALHHLLAAAETTLRERGQPRLRLLGQPFCYDPPAAAQLAEVLRQRGYPVALAALNYHLDLTQPYAARLVPAARQHLAECWRAGRHPEQEPPLLLPLAYEFMQACRQERGQQMPWSLPWLQALFRQFPRAYSLFSVREPSGDWAALTVVVQVNKKVLWAGAPASPLHLDAPGPAALLYAGLHAYGQASGLRVLDLGSSALASGPDMAQLSLWQQLGGVAGLQLSWDKALV